MGAGVVINVGWEGVSSRGFDRGAQPEFPVQYAAGGLMEWQARSINRDCPSLA